MNWEHLINRSAKSHLSLRVHFLTHTRLNVYIPKYNFHSAWECFPAANWTLMRPSRTFAYRMIKNKDRKAKINHMIFKTRQKTGARKREFKPASTFWKFGHFLFIHKEILEVHGNTIYFIDHSSFDTKPQAITEAWTDRSLAIMKKNGLETDK